MTLRHWCICKQTAAFLSPVSIFCKHQWSNIAQKPRWDCLGCQDHSQSPQPSFYKHSGSLISLYDHATPPHRQTLWRDWVMHANWIAYQCFCPLSTLVAAGVGIRWMLSSCPHSGFPLTNSLPCPIPSHCYLISDMTTSVKWQLKKISAYFPMCPQERIKKNMDLTMM